MKQRVLKKRQSNLSHVIAETAVDLQESGERSNADLDLRSEMERFRSHLLSNAIVNALIPHQWENVKFAVFAETVLFGLGIFLITTLVSKAINNSPPVLGDALLASAVTACSFAIIKLLHDGIFPKQQRTFPESLLTVAKDQSQNSLARWFQSFLSIWKQLGVSVLFGVAGISSLAAFARYAGSSFKVGSYILVFLCFFAGGNGAYCSIGIPTLIRRISKCDMELFWLSPADTPWIKEASWIFTKLALADAFVFAWGIVGLYLLKPFSSSATTLVALIWLVIGLGTILYTFLFPHHYLKTIIRTEKLQQVERFRKLLDEYQTTFESVNSLASTNEDDLKKLLHLMSIYEHLTAARESAIDLRALVGLVPSLLIPSLPYLSLFGRSLVEIGKRYGVI